MPETKYAESPDGVFVAYQVVGEGPTDVVLLDGWITPLEERWEQPDVADSLNRLASFARLISFDKRGIGLSDPVPFDVGSTLEEWASDVATVMDVVGSHRAVLFGHHDGGWPAMLFAASHPDRVSHLVLVNATARIRREPDNPWGIPLERLAPPEERIPTYAKTMVGLDALGPPEWGDWFVRSRRHQASPSTFIAMMRMQFAADLRAVLPTIRVPTLVLHRADNRFWRVGHGRYLAEKIPGARFVEVPGELHHWCFGDSAAIIDAVEEFVTGTRVERPADRVLATVLFTDVVDSTRRAVDLGDKAWRQLLDRYETAVRAEITRHAGREVFTKGDEFLITFDGPARAVRCAQAIRAVADSHGLAVRSGVHTGEIELRRDDIAGIAVHIGARTMASAQPNEILVTRTVTDLVAGSGLRFEDRGEHHLKGVPDQWHLYAARD